MTLDCLIPDLVYFNTDEYNLFKEGNLKVGSEFVIGENSSSTLIITVRKVVKNAYICVDNNGNVHNIDWDINKFHEKQSVFNKNKWAFYKIKHHG